MAPEKSTLKVIRSPTAIEIYMPAIAVCVAPAYNIYFINAKTQKAWGRMTAAELKVATAKYDRPFVAMNEAKPLTARDKKIHAEAARRGPGRPQVGEGVGRVLVSMERGLLRDVDAFAKARGIKRSELLATGVRILMSADIGEEELERLVTLAPGNDTKITVTAPRHGSKRSTSRKSA